MCGGIRKVALRPVAQIACIRRPGTRVGMHFDCVAKCLSARAHTQDLCVVYFMLGQAFTPLRVCIVYLRGRVNIRHASYTQLCASIALKTCWFSCVCAHCVQILPANIGVDDLVDTDKVLADELVAEGLSRANADTVATWHRKQYLKVAKAFSKKLKRASNAADSQSQAPVSCSPASAEQLLTLSQGESVRVQIHRAQFDKLKSLAAAALHGDSGGVADVGGAGGQGSGDVLSSDAKESRFLLTVLCLLIRYQALGGAGFQCAIPSPVFACLQQQWAVTCEGCVIYIVYLHGREGGREGQAEGTNDSKRARPHLHKCQNQGTTSEQMRARMPS